MSDTHELILNRMLNDIDSSYDKSKGQFVYDILSSAAIEFARGYAENEAKTSNNHINNAKDKDLEELVKQYANIERKKATYASGIVKITGDTNAKLFKGDLVSSGSINYEADKDYEADNDGIILANVRCTTLGNSGNSEANTIIYFPKTLNGIKSVTNIEMFTNGYDEETDEQLRKRYYDKIGDPETSGNVAEYKSWAKSVTGVGDAKVIECFDGPGTIKIVLVDSNGEEAGSELIASVQKYIESVRPACSGILTVESAKTTVVNINVTLDTDANCKVSDIKEDIEKSIKLYLRNVSFSQNIISYFAIADRIFNVNGVKNILSLKVNGDTSDIKITDTQIADLGSVIYG